MAQASAFRSALDQAGHIGHDKAFLGTHAHHAQIGVQGGERVVGDFGARVGNGGDQGGLSRVGHAQQTHIGQDLELEFERAALTGPTRGFLAGRTVGRAFVVHVAKTAITTLGQQNLFAGFQKFKQDLTRLGIGHDGAHGQLQDDVIAFDTKHVRAFAVFAALCVKTPRVTEVHQGVEAVVHQSIDVTAPTAVTAIGATEFFVFFVPEGSAAIAPIARSDFNRGFVHKLHDTLPLKKNTKGPLRGPFA